MKKDRINLKTFKKQSRDYVPEIAESRRVANPYILYLKYEFPILQRKILMFQENKNNNFGF